MDVLRYGIIDLKYNNTCFFLEVLDWMVWYIITMWIYILWKHIISLTHNINIIYKWIDEILIEQWQCTLEKKPTQNNKKTKKQKQNNKNKQTNKQTKIKQNRLGRVNCA